MNWAAGAAFAALFFLPVCAFADGSEAALLSELRAISQQYDRIAHRSSPQSPDLAQVREQYLNCLRRAAASGAKQPAIRDMAEIFVLSGGDPAILKPWREGLAPDGTEIGIFEGVLAYGEGRTSEAEPRLLAIDAASLNPMLGGHLSLAQALLTARNDPRRALGYLQTAALLLPGTLVEEAALRQSAVLAAKTGDASSFFLCGQLLFSPFPALCLRGWLRDASCVLYRAFSRQRWRSYITRRFERCCGGMGPLPKLLSNKRRSAGHSAG